MKLFPSTVQPEEIPVATFRNHAPDNLLRVESVAGGGVVICAAQNNFDATHRRTFVRYLKAEGFIPKKVCLVTGDSRINAIPMKDRVLWVYDPCWPYADARFNPYSRRQGICLLLGPMLAWLLLMWTMAFR